MNPISSTLRTALAVALMLSTATLAIAGERTLHGTVYGATSPGTQPAPGAQPMPWDAVEPLSVTNTDGTFGSTDTTNAYPLSLERWDRRDASGNLIDATRLKAVHLRFPLGLVFDFRTENTSTQALGWWQGDYWVEAHVTRDGQGGTEPASAPGWKVGGERGLILSANGTSLAPFDGALDGQGASSSRFVGASGYTLEITIPVGALDRTLRRTFVGQGEVTLFFEPRLRARSTGIPGHWRHQAAARFGLYELAPGRNVEVGYEYSDAPAGTLRHTWTSPWIAGGIVDASSSDSPTATLPAFPLDPMRIRTVRVEAQTYQWAHNGLENRAPFAAVCGGSATLVQRIEAPGALGPLAVAQQGIGSSGVALDLFDGTSDFDGPSGEEILRNCAWPDTTSWSSGPNPSAAQLAPWRAGPIQVELGLVSAQANPVPLTFGPQGQVPTFDWWARQDRDAWFRWVVEYD